MSNITFVNASSEKKKCIKTGFDISKENNCL